MDETQLAAAFLAQYLPPGVGRALDESLMFARPLSSKDSRREAISMLAWLAALWLHRKNIASETVLVALEEEHGALKLRMRGFLPAPDPFPAQTRDTL